MTCSYALQDGLAVVIDESVTQPMLFLDLARAEEGGNRRIASLRLAVRNDGRVDLAIRPEYGDTINLVLGYAMQNVHRVRVLNPGRTRTPGGEVAQAYVKVEWTGKRLSLSGVVGPLPNGNCLGSAGQIHNKLPSLEPNEGWTKEMLLHLSEVWRTWHLNDFQAGCIHQREMGWSYKNHHNPETFLGERCPVCGYRIGSRWLSKPVPPEVIDWLFSLPESEREPAWI